MADSTLEEADVFPAEKVSKIYVPDDISEETGIQGFVFSRKLLKVADPKKYTVPKTAKEISPGTMPKIGVKSFSLTIEGLKELSNQMYCVESLSNVVPNLQLELKKRKSQCF